MLIVSGNLNNSRIAGFSYRNSNNDSSNNNANIGVQLAAEYVFNTTENAKPWLLPKKNTCKKKILVGKPKVSYKT